MISRLRSIVARWLAMLVTVTTLGRVQVNGTGHGTTTSNDAQSPQAVSQPLHPTTDYKLKDH